MGYVGNANYYGREEIKKVSYSAERGLFITVLSSIEKWGSVNDFDKVGIEQLISKDTFYITGFTNEIDLQVKLQDGREGYLLGNYFSD